MSCVSREIHTRQCYCIICSTFRCHCVSAIRRIVSRNVLLQRYGASLSRDVNRILDHFLSAGRVPRHIRFRRGSRLPSTMCRRGPRRHRSRERHPLCSQLYAIGPSHNEKPAALGSRKTGRRSRRKRHQGEQGMVFPSVAVENNVGDWVSKPRCRIISSHWTPLDRDVGAVARCPSLRRAADRRSPRLASASCRPVPAHRPCRRDAGHERRASRQWRSCGRHVTPA